MQVGWFNLVDTELDSLDMEAYTSGHEWAHALQQHHGWCTSSTTTTEGYRRTRGGSGCVVGSTGAEQEGNKGWTVPSLMTQC
jgi:hypothetical protein